MVYFMEHPIKMDDNWGIPISGNRDMIIHLKPSIFVVLISMVLIDPLFCWFHPSFLVQLPILLKQHCRFPANLPLPRSIVCFLEAVSVAYHTTGGQGTSLGGLSEIQQLKT